MFFTSSPQVKVDDAAASTPLQLSAPPQQAGMNEEGINADLAAVMAANVNGKVEWVRFGGCCAPHFCCHTCHCLCCVKVFAPPAAQSPQ